MYKRNYMDYLRLIDLDGWSSIEDGNSFKTARLW